MKIISKSTAMKIYDKLLAQGKTVMLFKYDSCKYNWTSSADCVGKEVQKLNDVYAVYVERRVDSDGPYTQVMCITER